MVNTALNLNDTFRSKGLMADLLDDFFNDSFFNDNDFQNKNSSKVHVIEESKRYIIQFQVPGYNRYNLQLEIQGNELVVVANNRKRNQISKMEEGLSDKFIQLHSFTLPQDANPERVKAICHNGLLEVYVKKLNIAKKIKVIPVNDGTTLKKMRSQGVNVWRKLKQGMHLKWQHKNSLPV